MWVWVSVHGGCCDLNAIVYEHRVGFNVQRIFKALFPSETTFVCVCGVVPIPHTPVDPWTRGPMDSSRVTGTRVGPREPRLCVSTLAMPSLCIVCWADKPGFACPKCETRYCGEACQKHDWSIGHRVLCTAEQGVAKADVGPQLEKLWYPGVSIKCIGDTRDSKPRRSAFASVREAVGIDDTKLAPDGTRQVPCSLPVGLKPGGAAQAMAAAGCSDSEHTVWVDCYVGAGLVLAARLAGVYSDPTLPWKYPGGVPHKNMVYIVFGKDIAEALAPPVQCFSRGYWALRVSHTMYACVTPSGLFVAPLDVCATMAAKELVTWISYVLNDDSTDDIVKLHRPVAQLVDVYLQLNGHSGRRVALVQVHSSEGACVVPVACD